MKAVPTRTVEANPDPSHTGNPAIGRYPADPDGPFIDAGTTPVHVPAFYIGETEVTYQLWKAVYDWAADRGYSFANPGRQGGNGTTGGGPVGDNQHPVTEISWRDAVVWCNAYSEAMGKAPVYEVSGAVLRESEGSSVAAGDGKADNAVINAGNGYRLPSSEQWEYAARGGAPSVGEPWTFPYAGSDAADGVAWYQRNSGLETHEVKTKAANSLGLYDLTGNVWEWCQDPYTGGTRRVFRGGGWNNSALYYLGIAWCSSDYPRDGSSTLGFRVVCP
jgi:formylglycine-generating enzyme required for sulfatase activity